MNNSVLTKSQTKRFARVGVMWEGERVDVVVKVRYDDECGNGHNTFAITGDVYKAGRRSNSAWLAGGCIHDEVRKFFPDLAPYIKWHLTSSDGPMHYIANSMYHARQHGPTSARVYFEDPENNVRHHCVKYCKIAEAEKMHEDDARYTFEVDEKTAKVANLEYARNCAVWPEAELTDFTKEKLEARLPALMADFKNDMEALGFVY